jgi:YfiH family protein
MQPLIRRELNGLVAVVAHSTRADGDLSPSTVPSRELAERRERSIAYPWRALHQVHSDRVIVATSSATSANRPVGDALVTTEPRLVLAVHSGDCIPIGLISDGGAVAAAHAGWKGLEAGVLESTIRQLRQIAGDGAVTAVVGPHIRKESYEFGEHDLLRLSARFGIDVVAVTETGHPALDLTAALASELDRLGVRVEASSNDCTARDSQKYWSHRARREAGRIALAVWMEEAPND